MLPTQTKIKPWYCSAYHAKITLALQVTISDRLHIERFYVRILLGEIKFGQPTSNISNALKWWMDYLSLYNQFRSNSEVDDIS